MKRIYKYRMPPGQTIIQYPAGATVLLVGHQYDAPTLWLEVETTNAMRDRTVFVVATGSEPPADRVHIGSYQNDHGNVWHLYW